MHIYWKSMKKQLQSLFRAGIDFLVGTPIPATNVMPVRVVGGGTGTDAITFAGLSNKRGTAYPNMADADYEVIMSGEFASSQGDVVYVDHSTLATTGFTVIGLGSAEVAHCIVVGRIAGQPNPA